MHASLRPFAATGVAIVGAGTIAITPVLPPLPDVPVEHAVRLTASSDWADIFERAGASAAARVNSLLEVPAPVLQQIIANQIRYVQELPDVPGIVEQMSANFQRALAASTAPTTDTLDDNHALLFNALVFLEELPLPIGDLLGFSLSPLGKQIVAFSTTPLSGVLLGMVGPVLGPALVLGDNLQSIVNDFTDGTPDPASALNTLVNTPAQMTDAFLNGGEHRDITELVRAVGPLIGVEFPDEVRVGMAFGGLLSPGGSAFNALDMDYHLLDLIPIHLATGSGPGPIGSMIELTRAIARAIGWDGEGSPLAPAGGNGLAAANAVPRSVVGSRVATLTAPVTEPVEKDTNQQATVDAVDDAVTTATESEVDETANAVPQPDLSSPLATVTEPVTDPVDAVDDAVTTATESEVEEAANAVTDRKPSPENLIRDSIKAVPGQLAASRNVAGEHFENAVEAARDQLNAAISDFGKLAERAFQKPAKAAAGSSQGSGSAEGSSEGGSATAGSNEGGSATG